MATLTIRDLDEELKRTLRIRAASRNRSMEEEARQILRAALVEAPNRPADLAARIRSRVAEIGGVELQIEPREPIRPPPDFSASRATKRRTAKRPKRVAKARA
jgi:plasmid stability protein